MQHTIRNLIRRLLRIPPIALRHVPSFKNKLARLPGTQCLSRIRIYNPRPRTLNGESYGPFAQFQRRFIREDQGESGTHFRGTQEGRDVYTHLFLDPGDKLSRSKLPRDEPARRLERSYSSRPA